MPTKLYAVPSRPVAREAVILAAGLGSRLNGHEIPKPLRTVGGRPLLHRTLSVLEEAGIERVHVVVGYRADEIVAATRRFEGLSVGVDFIHNVEWNLSNGVSVLCAAPHVKGPFLLTMSDHVLSPGMVHAMARVSPPEGGVVLAVDPDLGSIFDMDDATKVCTDGHRIAAIGKDLTTYDCIDTGLFSCTGGLFDALAAERAARGDCSLSDGMRRLGRADLALVHPIGRDDFWQDVDTPETAAYAEVVLAASRALPLAEEHRAWTRVAAL
ncbi:MAG: hypothetical protein AMXMBFR64_44790 [Myxococcales bacterium]